MRCQVSSGGRPDFAKAREYPLVKGFKRHVGDWSKVSNRTISSKKVTLKRIINADWFILAVRHGVCIEPANQDSAHALSILQFFRVGIHRSNVPRWVRDIPSMLFLSGIRAEGLRIGPTDEGTTDSLVRLRGSKIADKGNQNARLHRSLQ